MDHHQHAAQPLLVKGGEQQLQALAAHGTGPVQVAGGLDRQHPLEGCNVGEQGIIVDAAANGNGRPQQFLGGRVGLDHSAVPGKGHHAVGHVEEQGAQLVALVLHLLQGVVELAGHVVEGAGEDADLIPGGYLQLLRKVAVGHPFRALGKPLNGGDKGFGQQEGEEH